VTKSRPLKKSRRKVEKKKYESKEGFKKTGSSLTYPSCDDLYPFQPVELQLAMSKR
jgi:hypothetical protein